jgi:hypothetical protein
MCIICKIKHNKKTTGKKEFVELYLCETRVHLILFQSSHSISMACGTCSSPTRPVIGVSGKLGGSGGL